MSKEASMEPRAPVVGGVPARMLQGAPAYHKPNAGEENETTSRQERSPEGNTPETDGPIVGKAGEYQPAKYPVNHEIETKTGERKVVQLTRQDR